MKKIVYPTVYLQQIGDGMNVCYDDGKGSVGIPLSYFLAAPALLAALQDALDDIWNSYDEHSIPDEKKTYWLAAKAAIAKAKGAP